MSHLSYCILLVVLLFHGASFSANNKNNMAINFTAKTMAGESYNYQRNKMEQPLVILFADSLCPFHHLPKCEIKTEEFNRLVTKYQGKVNFLQVVKGYYVTEVDVRRYIKNFSIKVPTIWDTDNEIFKEYGVFANPYAILINTQGNINYRKNNFIASLDKKITAMLY